MYQASGTVPRPIAGIGAILRPMSPVPRLPLLAALGAVLGLALTNPDGADFERFAADRLVEEIAEELCVEADLPLLLRMAVGNCEQQVRDQRAALAAVVQQHTHRTNLGLVSLFRSEIGGQRLLTWRVPRFRSLVLGIAGQFVVLQAGQDRDGAAGDPRGWLRP